MTDIFETTKRQIERQTKTFRIYFTERTFQDFEGKNLLEACFNSGYPASHFKNILKHEIIKPNS